MIPDDVVPSDLPRDARMELRSVAKDTADLVARHLVMAGRLLEDDPLAAYEHADAARRKLPRIAVVREAVGLCAYANGNWAEALAELRASKRISGSVEHLATMADCERGLGRPERALDLAASADARRLDRESAVEMRIVVSGARRDLGQPDAAVVTLQGADLDITRRDPWSARLFYAYADALLAAQRRPEAREWFVAAALADDEGATDAADRVDELDGSSSSAAAADDAIAAEVDTPEVSSTGPSGADVSSTDVPGASVDLVVFIDGFDTSDA